MLVRLLYASRAVDTSPAAIEAILTQSRQHNRLRHHWRAVQAVACSCKPSRAAARR